MKCYIIDGRYKDRRSKNKGIIELTPQQDLLKINFYPKFYGIYSRNRSRQDVKDMIEDICNVFEKYGYFIVKSSKDYIKSKNKKVER
jgi:hypothetical protein